VESFAVAPQRGAHQERVIGVAVLLGLSGEHVGVMGHVAQGQGRFPLRRGGGMQEAGVGGILNEGGQQLEVRRQVGKARRVNAGELDAQEGQFPQGLL
jgi:hypothetical protein